MPKVRYKTAAGAAYAPIGLATALASTPDRHLPSKVGRELELCIVRSAFGVRRSALRTQRRMFPTTFAMRGGNNEASQFHRFTQSSLCAALAVAVEHVLLPCACPVRQHNSITTGSDNWPKVYPSAQTPAVCLYSSDWFEVHGSEHSWPTFLGV